MLHRLMNEGRRTHVSAGAMVPYRKNKPVFIYPRFVFGNVHGIAYMVYERHSDGERVPRGWFGSMAEAVIWALYEERPIGNWDACAGVLEEEEETRRKCEVWQRELMG